MQRRMFLQLAGAAALPAQSGGAIYLTDLDHCQPAGMLGAGRGGDAGGCLTTKPRA